MAHRIHTAMESKQTLLSHPHLDRSTRHAQREQLNQRDDSMLAAGEPPNRGIP
ncbi:MAG TPA: hypothetical protein VES62_18015 [Thermoleophilaceae bacterium]|nr:hypothetical protein [Thermoleophilaceae bacterium]